MAAGTSSGALLLFSLSFRFLLITGALIGYNQNAPMVARRVYFSFISPVLCRVRGYFLPLPSFCLMPPPYIKPFPYFVVSPPRSDVPRLKREFLWPGHSTSYSALICFVLQRSLFVVLGMLLFYMILCQKLL